MLPRNQMPEPKRPFLTQNKLPLTILLLIGVLLSLLMPDFFRQVILAPILTRVATLYGIYRGFPQNVIWGFFVFVAFVVMLYATRPKLEAKEEKIDEIRTPSRLQQLVEISENASRGQNAKWLLAREIQRLIMETLQLETTETPEILQQRIQNGELPVPPEVENLFNVCASLPSYRSFLDARDAQPKRRIPQLATLDLQATVDWLVGWRQSSQEEM